MKMAEQHARKMKCVELAKTGMSFEEIGNAIGLSRETVRQTCAKHGIRRHKKSDEYKAAEQLFLAGMDDEYVALVLGKNEWCVSKVRRDLGLKKKNGYTDKCANRRNEIIAFRKSRHTIKETAEHFGVREHYVKVCCAGLFIGYADAGPIKSLEEREADARKQIEDAHAGVEYVDGFINTDSRVNVRCKYCGTVFSVCMSKFRGPSKSSSCCKICSMAHVRDTLVIKTYMREWIADETARTPKPKKQCVVCGALTTRKKYCSSTCAQKASNAAHDLKKRMFAKSKIVDKDITLQKLYLRDKGTCWICGMACDYSDFRRTEKAFIAGNLYPSIDHVKPRCEGGEHSWANIRLAHRKCNTARFSWDRKKNTHNLTFECDTLTA